MSGKLKGHGSGIRTRVVPMMKSIEPMSLFKMTVAHMSVAYGILLEA